MSGAPWRLARIAFAEGVWSGRLEGSLDQEPPPIRATLGDRVLAEAAPVRDGAGRWTVRLPLGADVLGEGPVTVLFGPADAPPLVAEVIRTDANTPADLAAEVADLRTELDLVKEVLRRLASQAD